jgi:hypothetical protein
VKSFRGQVVEGFGAASKRLMGTIADRQALGAHVHMNDWKVSVRNMWVKKLN